MNKGLTWAEIFRFIETLAPWAAFTVTSWKIVDKYFKYLADGREGQLREIVKEEMNPEINRLSDKIEQLSQAIWALKNK